MATSSDIQYEGTLHDYVGYMAWTDLVAGCFGFGTAPFATNRPDEENAKEAITAAKAEGATRAEFAQLIAMYPRKYIKSDQLLRERINEDAARLEKLWKASLQYR